MTIQLSIQYYPGRSKYSRKKKEIKIVKEEVKLYLFADNIIVFVENPKESTIKLLELRQIYQNHRIQ